MGAFALAKFCSGSGHKMKKMFPILLEVRYKYYTMKLMQNCTLTIAVVLKVLKYRMWHIAMQIKKYVLVLHFILFYLGIKSC